MEKKNFYSIVIENALLKKNKSTTFNSPVKLRSNILRNDSLIYSNNKNHKEISNINEIPIFKNKIILEELNNHSHLNSLSHLIFTPRQFIKNEKKEKKRLYLKENSKELFNFHNINKEQNLNTDFSILFNSNCNNLTLVKYHKLLENTKINKNRFSHKYLNKPHMKNIKPNPPKNPIITITRFKKIDTNYQRTISQGSLADEIKDSKQSIKRSIYSPIKFPHMKRKLSVIS